MTVHHLCGLPQFLRYACTHPAPEPLVTAMARGPLAAFGARIALIWRLEGDELVSLGRFGSTNEERDRYARIPLSLDFDIVKAVQSLSVITSPVASPDESQVSMAVDSEFWRAMVDRVGGVSLVSAPLVLDGRAVGGFGFMTDSQWPDDEKSRGVLDILGTILTLWLTHPRTTIPAVDNTASQSRFSLTLTERQVDILRRVEDGERNREIAQALSLSDSTVKQEVQGIMKKMRVSDRRLAADRARALGLMEDLTPDRP